MADAARDGDLVLERPALVAQDELAPVEHAGHRREELCAESRVLAGQVDEGDHLRRAPDLPPPSRVASPPPPPSRLSAEPTSLPAGLPAHSGLRLMYSAASAHHWNLHWAPARV